MRNIPRFALEMVTSLIFKMRIRLDKLTIKTKQELSDSENTSYVKAVKKIISDNRKFKKFRRNLRYKAILEHVSYKLGQEYFSCSTENGLPIGEIRALVANNDLIGKPRQFDYKRIGLASPTTLRYIKVSSDIGNLFKQQFSKVAEIGVGYGGQASVLFRRFEIENYYMFDLDPVLHLAEKFLAATSGKRNIIKADVNSTVTEKYDLVISNYAFSELPRALQEAYCEKVLAQSDKGYITMNSGLSDFTGRSSGKMSLPEIQQYLPKSYVFQEKPLTGPDNYILVWGNHHSINFQQNQ